MSLVDRHSLAPAAAAASGGGFAVNNAAVAMPSPIIKSRVASVIIKNTEGGNTVETMTPAKLVAVLFKTLDRCVVDAPKRCAERGSECDIPATLIKIEAWFQTWRPANASILSPLTTDYPALVRSLRVLKVVHNTYDDSAALGAFAALATGLQALTFRWCGLTSVQGLAGCGESLRTVDLYGCRQLSDIDALSDRVYLEEVNVSLSGITSIEPLRTCKNLIKVNLHGCRQLTSIDALGDHQRLQEFDASFTGIASIEPLLTCPALKSVGLSGCLQLSSIEAFACLNLTTVVISGCDQLPSDVQLPASVKVIR